MRFSPTTVSTLTIRRAVTGSSLVLCALAVAACASSGAAESTAARNPPAASSSSRRPATDDTRGPSGTRSTTTPRPPSTRVPKPTTPPTSTPAGTTAPRSEPSPSVVGAYWGRKADGSSYSGDSEDLVYLAPSGRYYRGFPAEGYIDEPTKYAPQMESGTWKSSGSTLVLTSTDGTVNDDWKLDTACGGVSYSGECYVRLDFSSPKSLSGTYQIPDLPSTPTVRFTADGHFTETGLLPFLFWSTFDQDRLRSTPNGSGTYRIVNSTLELHYGDGTVTRLLVISTTGRQIKLYGYTFAAVS